MILITGCARSGTSITANIVKACGAYMGDVNGNGENRIIRDEITKPYLAAQGFDPLCQDKLPTPDAVEPFTDLRERVEAVLGTEEPRAYKGAKLLHFWKEWDRAFPGAKYVIVRRDKDKIVDSCIRTVFMKNRSSREQWGEWVDQHIERFDEMKANLDCIEVWPDKAVKGDYSEYKRMIEFVGLEWNEESEQVINPSKWHG